MWIKAPPFMVPANLPAIPLSPQVIEAFSRQMAGKPPGPVAGQSRTVPVAPVRPVYYPAYPNYPAWTSQPKMAKGGG